MEKQSLIAVLLSLVVLIGYQYFISHFYPSPPPNTLPPSETQTTTPVEKKLPLPGQPQEEGLGQRSEQPLPSATTANTPSPREFTIENDVYTAVFSSLGGTLKSLHLKQYPGDEGRNSAPREMIAPGPQGELPIEVRLEGKGITDTDAGVPYQVIRGNNTVSIQGDEQSTLEFRGTTANGATITKRLTFSGRTYGIGLEIQVENAPQNVSLLSVV